MSIQMSELTVNDPLADQEVAVVMRVLPDNAHRPARTVLVSVGTAGQPPVFLSGVLEDVADVIRQAWLAYGVQVEVRQHRAGDSTAADVETVAEATVDETPAASPLPPRSRKSQPQNLSLF